MIKLIPQLDRGKPTCRYIVDRLEYMLKKYHRVYLFLYYRYANCLFYYVRYNASCRMVDCDFFAVPYNIDIIVKL